MLLRIIKEARKDIPSDRWIPLTHVCQRWYYAAMGDGHLWTKISVSERAFDRAHTYLQLSKDVSLDIHLSIFPPETLPEDIKITSPQAQRIASLEAVFNRSVMQSFLDHAWPPFPKLRALKFIGWAEHDSQIPPVFGENMLASLQGSNLESQELMGVTLPLEPHLFANLHSLTILHYRKSLRTPPPMNLFVDVLANCPRLECLDVTHAGPRLGPDIAATLNVAPLQSLTLVQCPRSESSAGDVTWPDTTKAVVSFIYDGSPMNGPVISRKPLGEIWE